MKTQRPRPRIHYSLGWYLRRLRFVSRFFFRRLLARTFIVYLDMASGQTFPKKPRKAHIYTTTIFVVDRPYMALGTIVVKGNRFTDPKYLLEKMKHKARQIGADAIYGVQVEEGTLETTTNHSGPPPSKPGWIASGIAVMYKTDVEWLSREKP